MRHLAKLATFTTPDAPGRDKLGRINADGQVEDLTAVVGDRTLLDVIATWAQLSPALIASTGLPVAAGARLRAPIPQPHRNVFAVGKNYRDHITEFGRSGYDTPDHAIGVPSVPVVFSKVPTAVTGPRVGIDAHPTVTKELDYEAELAVIIGRGGRGC